MWLRYEKGSKKTPKVPEKSHFKSDAVIGRIKSIWLPLRFVRT